VTATGTPPRTYTKHCDQCGQAFEMAKNRRIPVTCSQRECLDAAAEKHNAARAAERAARPRKPRTTRPAPRPIMGDWSTVVRIGNRPR